MSIIFSVNNFLCYVDNSNSFGKYILHLFIILVKIVILFSEFSCYACLSNFLLPITYIRKETEFFEFFSKK